MCSSIWFYTSRRTAWHSSFEYYNLVRTVCCLDAVPCINLRLSSAVSIWIQSWSDVCATKCRSHELVYNLWWLVAEGR